MRLEAEPGCIRRLTWRPATSTPELALRLWSALRARGLPEARPLPGLQVFEGPFGGEPGWRHRVLLVATSGRIQLRLDYRVPYERRRQEAERLWALLGRWLREAAPPGDIGGEGE